MVSAVRVPRFLVEIASDYFETTGRAFMREARDGERILYLGYSLGQDRVAVLSEVPEREEEYMEPAAIALAMLPRDLPSKFNCEGSCIFRLNKGFYDMTCEYCPELTFDHEFHVSIFQYWLDSVKCPICIRPASDYPPR